MKEKLRHRLKKWIENDTRQKKSSISALISVTIFGAFLL